MDWRGHYDRLIDRAKNRVLSGYVEVHHIIPRCMRGSDDKENLVQLTAEEHYVSHQLLCRIYPGVAGLLYAVIAMSGKTNSGRNNKLYGWIRRKAGAAASEGMKEIHKDPEFRSKWKSSMEALRSDTVYQEKIRAAVSRAHKGRVKSPQERANIAEAGRKRAPRVFSEQARANMAAARKKTWEERRANGTDKMIGQKTAATRRKNGSYDFTEKHRRNIGEATRRRFQES